MVSTRSLQMRKCQRCAALNFQQGRRKWGCYSIPNISKYRLNTSIQHPQYFQVHHCSMLQSHQHPQYFTPSAGPVQAFFSSFIDNKIFLFKNIKSFSHLKWQKNPFLKRKICPIWNYVFSLGSPLQMLSLQIWQMFICDHNPKTNTC